MSKVNLNKNRSDKKMDKEKIEIYQKMITKGINQRKEIEETVANN